MKKFYTLAICLAATTALIPPAVRAEEAQAATPPATVSNETTAKAEVTTSGTEAAPVAVAENAKPSAEAKQIALSEPAEIKSKTTTVKKSVKKKTKKTDTVEKTETVTKTVTKTETVTQTARVEKKTSGDSIFPEIKFKEGNISLKFDFITRIKNKNYLEGINVDDDNQNILAFRQLRPGFNLKIGDNTRFRYVIEFAKGDGKTVDAFLQHKFNDYIGVDIGKYKSPVSYENLISDGDIMFTERSMITDLTPNRDVGIQFFGKPLKYLEYKLAYFIGRDNRSALHVDHEMNKKIAGRVDVAPFGGLGGFIEGLKLGLGFGVSDREDPRFAFTNLATSNARETYFRYSRTTLDGGKTSYLTPVVVYTQDNFGGYAEYTVQRQEVRTATLNETLSNRGWQVTVAYNLTGEKQNFKEHLSPTREFNWNTGDFGAIQLVGRVSQVNVDDDAFPAFASIATAAKRATEFAAGVNWYLTKDVHFQSNISHTNFDGGAVGGRDREDEIAQVNVLQIKF